MQPKNDKLSNILGLYLLGAIGLAGVAGYFVIKPFYAQGQGFSASTTVKNADIAALNKLSADTDTLRGNYQTVKNQRDSILKQLPTKSEEERLLALLSSLGQSSNTVVASFTPAGISNAAAASAASSVSIYPANVTVKGTYESIQSFLRKIEEGARFIDIQNASFSASAKGSAVNVDATFSISAYYQLPSADPTVAPSTSTGGKK